MFIVIRALIVHEKGHFKESRLVCVTGAGDSPPTTAGEVAGSH
jgi:hypothetical protein